MSKEAKMATDNSMDVSHYRTLPQHLCPCFWSARRGARGPTGTAVALSLDFAAATVEDDRVCRGVHAGDLYRFSAAEADL